MVRYKDALDIALRYPFKLKSALVYSDGYIFEYKRDVYKPYLEILYDGSKIHFINIEHKDVKERVKRSRLLETFS